MKTCLTYWRRKCQPTPVFSPVEFHGQRSLEGCSPWGCKESDTTEQFSLHFTAWHILTHLDIQKNFANNSSTERKKNASRWFELLFSSLSFLSSKSIISSLCPGAVIDLKSGFGSPGRSGCVVSWDLQMVSADWAQKIHGPVSACILKRREKYLSDLRFILMRTLKHQVKLFAKTVLSGCQLCVQRPD